MRKLIINKGEKICPKCNGSSYSNKYSAASCDICKNYGKLDWISSITPRSDYRIQTCTIINIKSKKKMNNRKGIKAFKVWRHSSKLIPPNWRI